MQDALSRIPRRVPYDDGGIHRDRAWAYWRMALFVQKLQAGRMMNSFQRVSLSSTQILGTATRNRIRIGAGNRVEPSPRFRIPRLLILLILLIARPSAAFDGLVVSIADGDTLTVLVDRARVKVRLADIDAPERAQPFGTRSRQALAALCFRKPAVVDDQGRDRYGRTIGRVSCNGADAGTAQVTAGLAWVYDKYASPDSPLYGLQDRARSERRGLWVDAEPVAPWAWRSASRARMQR